jgi:hypothetical protein
VWFLEAAAEEEQQEQEKQQEKEELADEDPAADGEDQDDEEEQEEHLPVSFRWPRTENQNLAQPAEREEARCGQRASSYRYR